MTEGHFISVADSDANKSSNVTEQVECSIDIMGTATIGDSCKSLDAKPSVLTQKDQKQVENIAGGPINPTRC